MILELNSNSFYHSNWSIWSLIGRKVCLWVLRNGTYYYIIKKEPNTHRGPPRWVPTQALYQIIGKVRRDSQSKLTLNRLIGEYQAVIAPHKLNTQIRIEQSWNIRFFQKIASSTKTLLEQVGILSTFYLWHTLRFKSLAVLQMSQREALDSILKLSESVNISETMSEVKQNI